MKKAFRLLFIVSILAILFSSLLLPTNAATAKEIDVGIPVRDRQELFLKSTLPTVGDARIIVLLIEFPDYKRTEENRTVDYYKEIYFGTDPDYPTSGKIDPLKNRKSVSSFFYEESYGKMKLSGEVFDWYTAKHERSYYNNRKDELVNEALQHYISLGVDFSGFDGDNDGTIDAVIYHFAGKCDFESDRAWYDGVTYTQSQPKLVVSGKKIFNLVQMGSAGNMNYNVTSIMKVICHELSHAMGVRDLYSKSNVIIVGDDLMFNERYFINPYYKMLLGWTDKVTVLTSPTQNFELKSWEESGEIAIIAKNFESIYDELFVMVYTKGAFRIWHIDARLTADGSNFRYHNLYYLKDPVSGDAHGDIDNNSPYPFAEEISSYAKNTVNVVGGSIIPFDQGDALGPNNLPCSDTHDGKYTGIRVYDFKPSGDIGYFSVSFEKDNIAPELVTGAKDLEISDTLRLLFSENVYLVNDWTGAKIIDFDGNEIPAVFSRAYDPCFLVNVSVDKTRLINGYTIIIPKGILVDSSGNAIEETILEVTIGTQLPDGIASEIAGLDNKYLRRQDIFTASYGNEYIFICLISELKTAKPLNSYIEYFRYDSNGNCIVHNLVKNPMHEEYCGRSIIQTKDDHIIMLFFDAAKGGPWTPKHLVCLDNKGEIAWSKANAVDASWDASSFPTDNGVAIKTQKSWVEVNSKTGEITDLNLKFSKIEAYTESGIAYGGYVSGYVSGQRIYISQYDLNTYKQIRDAEITMESLGLAGSKPSIDAIYANDDGYVTVIFRINIITGASGDCYGMILNDKLEVIKIEKLFDDLTYKAKFHEMPDGGFMFGVIKREQDHKDKEMYFVRYDSYLNLMWQKTVMLYKYGITVTDTNRVWLWHSVSESVSRTKEFLTDFGSEEEFKHVHTLTFTEGRAATCTETGVVDVWYCDGCGLNFASSDASKILSKSEIEIPMLEHNVVNLPSVAPTCTESGLTKGEQCSLCGKVLKAQNTIPAKGHSEKVIQGKPATCTESGLTDGKSCTVCGKVTMEQKKIAAKGHTETIDPAVEPTVTSTGLTEGKHCSVCNAIIVKQEVIPVAETVETEAATEPETTTAPEVTSAVSATENDGGCSAFVNGGAMIILIALAGLAISKKKE